MKPSAPNPPLAVVMPVLNAMPFVDEAVASILRQSFAAFEFIILDDGSTDGSLDALRGWAAKDSRIRLFAGERRRGPAGSSNFVVAQARAPVVARMDADDVAHPDRLRLQFELLEKSPDAVLVGALSEPIDANGQVIRPADYAKLSRNSLFPPFAHPSIMFRRSAFDAAGGYRAEADKWEDVDLFLRMATRGRVLTVARPLIQSRSSSASSRIADGSDELEAAIDRMHRCLTEYAAGRNYDDLLRDRTPPARLRPESYIAAGSVALWAQRPPRTWRRMRNRLDWGWNLRTATAVGWAAWAALSPASLRKALRARLFLSNLIARRKLGNRMVVDWHAGGARHPSVQPVERSA